MRNKIISISLILITLVTSGFGCKGMSAEQAQLTKPIALEYWTVFDDVDALNKAITKYRATRPYLTVNVRQLSADELYPRLVEALSEDNAPDIISVQNRSLRQFQTKLATMPSIANDTTVITTKGTLGNNTTVSTVTRPLLTLQQVDQQYVKAVKEDVIIGDKIYGLPLSLDMMAIFYNKDLLDKAGIPEAPKTWEEFQVDVKKITKYDAAGEKILQYGTALGTGDNVAGVDDILYILFKQSGVDLVNKSGMAVFNANKGNAQAPAAAVMDFYTDFANKDRDTYSWNGTAGESLEKFVSGSVGFFFGYSYHYPIIKARNPQLDFRIMPMLQLNPDFSANAANYWAQCVVGKSKNQNAAWALLDYLAHSAATKEYLDASGRLTAMRAYINEQKTKQELEPFVSQILTAQNWYHGRDYAGAVKALKDMAEEWLMPIPNPDQAGEWRQNILNRGASKVNQTL